jgi:hypothetical protein
MFGDLSSVIAGIAVLAAEANLCGVHEEKGEARMDGHRASQQLAAWRCCSRVASPLPKKAQARLTEAGSGLSRQDAQARIKMPTLAG